MLKVLGENYYIDFLSLESITNLPKIENKNGDNQEPNLFDDTQHISIVKYEVIKMMLEVILTEREEVDENLGVHNSKNLSLPFKFAFNTLLMYGIIKHL